MSRTYRRVNKYVSYCTLAQVKKCHSSMKIASMDPKRYQYVWDYMVYDEKYAAKFYRDGMKRNMYRMENRKNSIYKSREKAYYKEALSSCLKSDDREFLCENVRKKLAGLADWW